MQWEYGCAILAGGAGRRMGLLNKAQLQHEGKSFLEIIAAELEREKYLCRYISVANYEQHIPEGWLSVVDELPTEALNCVGPVGGIYSCLRQAERDGLDGLFFAPCDLPLFECSAHKMIETLIDDNTDVICFRTSDGKVQTTTGWYSVRMISILEDDIRNGRNKLVKSLERANLQLVDPTEFSVDERIFLNVNTASDYEQLRNESAECGCVKQHILITGEKQVGKTTLINRIIEEIGVPVYGYQTRVMKTDEEARKYTYIYPAGCVDGKMSELNFIGCSNNKVIKTNTEVFNNYGVALLNEIHPGGVIVMDEIGFMESEADLFCQRVMELFCEKEHIIGVIKDIENKYAYLDAIRNLDNIEVITVNIDNRNEAYMKVRSIIKSWNINEGRTDA